MSATPQLILCDGCGIAASPEHIRERVARLELATRFRPIHISVLFVIASPGARADFYNSAESSRERDVLLDGLGITAWSSSNDDANATVLRLTEFQKRGFYFASVSECPLPSDVAARAAVERLAHTLLKRIQFSYKPKAVVLLSDELAPTAQSLAAAGQGIRTLLDGKPLAWPPEGDGAAEAAFRAACARIADALA